MNSTCAPLVHAFHGFGTEVCVRLWPRPGREQEAMRALQRAVALLRRAERRLSRFDPRSDLSRINRRAGEPVRVARLTREVVAEALAAAHATGGLFDPTVLRAVQAAGYDRDFALLAERGAVQLAAPPVQRARFRAVAIDAHAGTVCVPEGVGLDLGGIAKGWLADAVVRRLRRSGAALADLGGDIAVAGSPPGGEAWEVEVADPWDGSRTLGLLYLRAGGVATSGVLRRRWRTPDGPQHHIIDPRTGRPACTDLVQATVAAPRAAAAEAAATAALLLGRDQAAEVLALSGCLAGVLVDVHGAVTSVGFSNRERWVTWHPTEA
jgi:thiamine biosynthesis lipoprotein